MVFSSLTFIFVFLPIVLILYYLSPKRIQNVLILISGLIFYAWGEPIYVGVLILSTLIDYLAGIIMYKYDNNIVIRRIALITSIVMNLSLLGVFKYSGFFIDNFNLIFDTSFVNPKLVLPIGISFFTFQSMSYTIDLYLRKINVQKNPINFTAFVTLFPQIVAGPIVRYKDVEKELNHREITVDMVSEGIFLFINGLAKKVLIANNIGLLWTTVKAMEISNISVLTAWLGIIAFFFQIYFDFSGYSDMAVGLGKMLGFHFPKNFNYPYMSRSISEFWRRWHITLGDWFKSYVYIPLGGSKKGLLRAVINLLIVWFLSGLWHGASWNYVIWGLYFGIIIIIEKLFLGKILKKIPGTFSVIYTIFLVILSWVIFDGGTLDFTLDFYKTMFGASGKLIDGTSTYLLENYIVIIIIAIFAATNIFNRCFLKVNEKYSTVLDYVIPFIKVALLIVSTAYLVNATYNPFLYFNF